MKIVDIWINCPDREVATKISTALIERRLVACSNIYGPIDSCYRWKGAVESASEVPLLVKTRAALFDQVAALVKSLHPYETPSILGIEVLMVNRDYQDWVVAETEPDSSSS